MPPRTATEKGLGMRGRLFVAGIATALGLLGPVAGASAQAPGGDSVTGAASECTEVGVPNLCFHPTDVTVDARSGPNGENPTGTVTWERVVGSGFIIGGGGSVTCLAVDGNVAVVGFRSSAHDQSLLRVVDGGSGPGQDSFSVVTIGHPSFEFPPPDCSSFPPPNPGAGIFFFDGGGANDEGDLIVRDATGDLTPPVLTVPSTITVNASRPSGATVAYSVSATDNADPQPTINCSPPSGSTFRIGVTTVKCTAIDLAGNTATATFQVVVRGAGAQLTDLTALVQGLGLEHGTARSFVAKLESARAALTAENRADGCGSLKAFINHAKAQSGKKLTTAQANRLILDTSRIRAVLGCG
jgi:hypothetical protein